MKEDIREMVLAQGAALCGFANIDRFADAPEGFRPTDLFAECKTVVVFALDLPKGLMKVNPRLLYMYFNSQAPKMLDVIAYNASLQIERQYGALAVPVPSDGPYEYWDAEKSEGRGLISMKHAAVNAGLGTLGKNTLLMNKKYGNMLTIGALLTNLDLPSDALVESICLPNCRLCLDSCPVQALDGVSANQLLCRRNTYGVNARGFDVVNCNKCRLVCPMRFGMK